MIKDLNLLRLLLVLDETRQTVQAAKVMNVSQPTISVMLKKLREQFQDQLFVRDKNQLEPTPRCRLLLQSLPPLLDQMEALYTEHEEWDISSLNHEMSLLFPPPLMAVLAAPLIKKLTELAPNVTVECTHWGDNAIQMLETRSNAWGVCYLPMETNKNLFQKDLGEDRFMLLMRKDHPLEGNRLEDVLNYPLCINIIPGYIEPSKAEMLIKKYGLNKHVSVRSSDMSMMLSLISQSNYICVVTEKYADIVPDTYRCESLPSELYKDTFRREFSLFTHQRNRLDPMTEWLYKEIKAILS